MFMSAMTTAEWNEMENFNFLPKKIVLLLHEWKHSLFVFDIAPTLSKFYSGTFLRICHHHTILSLGEIVVGDKRFAAVPYRRDVV
jgi:hypothetical protein